MVRAPVDRLEVGTREEGPATTLLDELAEPRSGADAQEPSLLRRNGSWARLTAGVGLSTGLQL